MDETKKTFLMDMYYKAVEAGHIFPFAAACEVALESGWGNSSLFRLYSNPFGQKIGPYTTQYNSVELPTHEYEDGNSIQIVAKWVIFSDLKYAFLERMNLLRRLKIRYPDYGKALVATNAADFILNVSKTWATDPERGNKVLSIYLQYAAESGIDPISAKKMYKPETVVAFPKTNVPWYQKFFGFFRT